MLTEASKPQNSIYNSPTNTQNSRIDEYTDIQTLCGCTFVERSVVSTKQLHQTLCYLCGSGEIPLN